MIHKLKEAHYGRLKELISKIALKNEKGKLVVYTDLFYNVLKYKIGYTDYMKGNYVNLTKQQKKDFLTSANYEKIIQYLNKDQYTTLFSDKIMFNKIFNDYLHRQFLDLRVSTLKQFQEFLKGKKHFFAKKHNSFGGDGIEKIILEKELDIKDLYHQLIQKKQYLIEETIIQHDVLNEINPYAVNNIRVMTLRKDQEVHILACVLRVNGNQGAVITCHDVFMFIDDDGNVISNVVDDEINVYEKHPETGFVFHNAKIPYMKECIEMAKQAALEVPEVRFVGWDIGISQNGPVMIEGNFYPSYGLFQYYLLTGESVGYLKKIKDILKEEWDLIKW